MEKKRERVNRGPTEEETPSRPVKAHRRAGEGQRATCAVLTVSDSRTRETDRGGRLVVERLEAEGHRVVAYDLLPDDPEPVEAWLRAWLADGEARLIITTGGTGLARRDTTVEVVEALLDKPMDGFGELFRMLSYEQIGAAAMLSRAVAGLAGEAFLFALPGSPNAVALALDRLILPELGHLLALR